MKGRHMDRAARLFRSKAQEQTCPDELDFATKFLAQTIKNNFVHTPNKKNSRESRWMRHKILSPDAGKTFCVTNFEQDFLQKRRCQSAPYRQLYTDHAHYLEQHTNLSIDLPPRT